MSASTGERRTFAADLEHPARVDLGFNRQNILLFTVRPGLNGYKGAQLDDFYLDLQRRIERLPGVAVGHIF